MLELPSGITPFNGEYQDQHFVSMLQLNQDDVAHFIDQATNARSYVDNPDLRGVGLLPYAVLKAVMKQPSTRTGGSMATAMNKLGGKSQVISGMESSSEGKGESPEDSWIAFATQADIIGIRSAEDHGVSAAATALDESRLAGNLEMHVPVINLGDGQNEHPTQALGDLFTIYQKFDRFSDLTIGLVGDHERYRAIHSLMIGAKIVGMNVLLVESEAAKAPQDLVDYMGKNLVGRTRDVVEALQNVDIIYMGRNPDEYTGENAKDKERQHQLTIDYKNWVVDRTRLQKMKPTGILMHPRPRNGEVAADVDLDKRSFDIQQMRRMIPVRMAIIAALLGKTIPPVM